MSLGKRVLDNRYCCLALRVPGHFGYRNTKALFRGRRWYYRFQRNSKMHSNKLAMRELRYHLSVSVWRLRWWTVRTKQPQANSSCFCEGQATGSWAQQQGDVEVVTALWHFHCVDLCNLETGRQPSSTFSLRVPRFFRG